MGKFIALFFFIGIGFLVACGIYTYKVYQFDAAAKTAKAEVIKVKKQYIGKAKNVYIHSIKFTTADDSEITTEVRSSSEQKKGSKMEIIYDPKDPKSVYLDSFMGKWMLSFILFCSGLAFTVPVAISWMKED